MFVVIAALALSSCLCLSVAHADDAPQFGIRPADPGSEPATNGYFVFTAQPGETLTNSVVVSNPGTVPITVLLYPVDATTGQMGGAAYLNRNDPRTDVGTWVTIENTRIDVPPQKQVTVNFTVVVPPTAWSGQHLGGIVAQLDTAIPSATTPPQTARFGITTITRAVIAALINVGPDAATRIPSFQITGAQITTVDGLPTLTLAIQNNGDSLAKPHGDVTMTDGTGSQVLANQFALDTFLPQTAIQYPVQVAPPTLPGTYTVRATLDFGGSAPATFVGQVIVTVQATATATTAPRSRLGETPTPALPLATPGSAVKTAAVGSDHASLVIWGGIAGLLLLGVTGLTVALLRRRGGQSH
jgi:hypothetical protein